MVSSFKVISQNGFVVARFTTQVSHSGISSLFGRSFPDFSNLEVLVGQALGEELYEKVDFSINHGDGVFQDVASPIEIKSSHTVDGILMTAMTTMATVTTTTTIAPSRATRESRSARPSNKDGVGHFLLTPNPTASDGKFD